jgi:glycosyltransferase involved in cell wall biosynthesis
MSLDLREVVSPVNGYNVRGETDDSPARRLINVLAYVHLRNIHASTGAGRVARQMIEHLAQRKNIEIQILADKADYDRVLPLVGEPWQSFRYQTFLSDTSRQQARWFLLNTPKAEHFWPDADIVYCTGESYVPVTKARLVVTAHDAAYFEQGAHRPGTAFWRQRLKWKLLFDRLSARVDMIHTVSEFSADRLAHFFPSLAARIRVVPNAVTPHFFGQVSRAGLDFIAERGLDSRPYILIPGGLSFRKNAELILDVAPTLLAQNRDLTIVVSGHNDPQYVARVAEQSIPIQLLGFVDDDALHSLYSHAAAVWFPTLYEGFGMPVLEAMASGAPVVASNTSSIPEIAGNAALLADPAKPMDQVELLTALIKDEELRERMIQLGRDRAAHFTWCKSVRALNSHFEEIL